MSLLSLDDARRLFGSSLLGPESLTSFVGGTIPTRELRIDTALAEQAQREGCLLLYRPAELPDGTPITLASLFERVATLASPGSGFRSEDPWFLRDPIARSESVEAGWALVSREPWPETCNQTYDAGDRAIAHRAAGRPWRRRRGVEAAFDTLAFRHVRGVRLLAESYDWTATPSADGGFLNVGGFDEGGLDVLAYSAPVKHGRLGSCPTLIAV